MYEARQCRHGDGDPSHSGIIRLLNARGAHGRVGEIDGIARHVAKGDEPDAEEARAQLDRVAAVGRLPVDVLQVVEVAAGAGHGLLDAVDGVPRHVEAVLDIDVGAAQAVDDASEPEEEGGAGGVGAEHDAGMGVEDAGALKDIC